MITTENAEGINLTFTEDQFTGSGEMCIVKLHKIG